MTEMKKKTILKILAVIALLFVGNRFFNHVTAWGGIAIMLFAVALAVYFIVKPTNINKDNEKD